MVIENIKKAIEADLDTIYDNKEDKSDLVEIFKKTGDNNKISFALSKINRAKKILIVGDKDVDGITSTVMMKKIIDNFTGEREVHTFIPSRYDGYSLDVDITENLIQNGDYNLIVYLDNGSSYENVKKIEERKLQKHYVVIDHHPIKELEEFPDFVINPNIKGDVSTSTGLLISYIYDYLYNKNEKCKLEGKNPIFKEEWNEDYFDELRVLSALADMVDKNSKYNRGMILKGLKKIEKSSRFLYDNANIEDLINYLNFKIIPLINAVGRMASTEDINKKIDFETFFFETKNKKKFKQVYEEVNFFNDLRKEATEFFSKLAFEEFEKQKDKIKNVFVFYHDNMPIGINGLIAQKLYQMTGIPIIAVSPNPIDPTIIYGSGRGENLKKAVEYVKLHNPHLDFSFGGHLNAFGIGINAFVLDDVLEALKNCDYPLQIKKPKTFNENVTPQQLIELSIYYKNITYKKDKKIFPKATTSVPLDKDYFVKVKFDEAKLIKKYNDLYARASIDGVKGLINPEMFNKILDLDKKELLLKLPYGKENIAFDIHPSIFKKPKIVNNIEIKEETQVKKAVKMKKKV